MPTHALRMSARAVVAAALAITSLAALAANGDPSLSPRPGPLGNGVTLLPNGWKIAPAGLHVSVGDLPLAMAESPDGRALFVATNGYLKPTITVVDTANRRVQDSIVLDHAWLGLAWHPDGKHLYVSGASNNTVHDDAAATPMYLAFQATPSVAPFTHLEPRVSLAEKNQIWTYGAEASMKMNLAEADLAPERELNEILWRSIKGSSSAMPPIVRAGFIRRAGDRAEVAGAAVRCRRRVVDAVE